MSTKERNALAVLLAVGVAGHAIRVFAHGAEVAPGGLSIIAATGPGEVAVHRAKSAAVGRPLAPGERIDLNRANAAELDRLPGIGAGLAARLIAERKRRGGFHSFAAVDSVPGVGAALIDRIAPFVHLPDTARRGVRSVVPTAPPGPIVVAPKRAKAKPSVGADGQAKIRVNTATERELTALPGIGPARAKAIVAYRQANGPFASVKELEKVPGLRPSVIRRFADQVVIP